MQPVKTMEPLRLMVEVPVMAAYSEQRGRQTMWIKAPVPMSIEATVYGLSRVRPVSGGEQFKVKALVCIPRGFTNQIPKSDYVDDDHAWVDCLYAANRTALAAFHDCSDEEWMSLAAPRSESAAVSA